MFRDGPIPLFVHGAVEYAAGILCLAAPFVLDWDKPSATIVSIIVGVVILTVAASSDLPTGITKSIPRAAHVMLDIALAAFLLAAPFMFGFNEATTPTVFFLALGAAHLVLTFATQFRERADRESG